MRYLALLILLFPMAIFAQTNTCANGDALVVNTGGSKNNQCIPLNQQPAGTGTTMIVANASVTGTTANRLAKLTGAPSTAVITATSDTENAVGIVTAGAGTTGNATITIIGQASCEFDNATVAGDYFIISSITAGKCHDAGSSYPTGGATYGRVLSTNGGAGTYVVELMTPDVAFQNGGNGKSKPAGSLANIQYNNSNQFGAISDGTAGQLLTSNGAGTPASFQTFTPAVSTTLSIADVSGLTAMFKLVRNTSSDQWTSIGGMTDNYSQTGAQAASSFNEGWFSAWQSTTGLSNTGTAFDSSYNKTQLSWHPIFAGRFRTDVSDITGSRIWVGVFSADPFASATPALSYIAFRYDTGADGTAFWRCVTDNGSGSPTVTTSASSIAINTSYDLRFEVGASSVAFYVNNGASPVCTHTTTLPGSTTAMGWQFGVKSLGGANKLFYANNARLIQPR